MPDAAAPGRPSHIVLVGLMGSGKTTVGKKLAKLIGQRFVDADVELEARTGRSVASWFEDGEAAFRAALLFSANPEAAITVCSMKLLPGGSTPPPSLPASLLRWYVSPSFAELRGRLAPR